MSEENKDTVYGTEKTNNICGIERLKGKDVFEVTLDRKIGRVSDVEIDISTGNITALTVVFKRCFSRKKKVVLPWSCIQKIEDKGLFVCADEESLKLITHRNAFQKKLDKCASAIRRVHRKIFSKKIVRSIVDTVGACARFVWRHAVLQSALIAFLLFLLSDILCYRSFGDGIWHMLTRPHIFLMNVLIVWITLLPAVFFKHRYAIYSFVSALWIGFSIANCVMLTPGIRTTPLEANDLEMLFTDPKSIVAMITENNFLTLPVLILIVAAISLALIAIVIFFFKLPKVSKVPYLEAGISFVSVAAILVLTVIGFRGAGILPERFKYLKDAYREYGFAYCFPCTFFDRGIDMPSRYESEGEEKIDKLRGEYGALQSEEDTPNVIFIQLESFFNVMDLTSYEFSEDPTPFFNSLKGDFPYGYLTVPSIAAGTANTEFEIISGMSLEFFGAAEYPYKTILQEEVCESTAFALKDAGYTATAIHNHTATFYDRHSVYAKMGFDRFISREFMEDSYNQNQTGWVRDTVLTKEIMNTLAESEGKDYIYTVSVQAHGGYPQNEVGGGFGIEATALSGDIDEAEVFSCNYYINQLRDMDNFLRELTEQLSEYPEDVVLVMFGDHLPGLDIEKEDFEKGKGGIFQTEYVMWSNFEMPDAPTERKNLQAYQLSAYVLDLVGLHEGNIIRYHQTCSADYQSISQNKEYRKNLHLLQYDMLYGKKFVYDEQSPYEESDIQYGLYETRIDEIVNGIGGFGLMGTGFTPDAQVMVNGEEVHTIFISGEELAIALEEDEELTSGDKISICFRGGKGVTLRKVTKVYSE